MIATEKENKIVNWSEVLIIKNGKNQRKVENPNGRYPIYGSGGVMGYADDYLCEEDTVIIGRKGSINKPLYITEKFWNVDTAFGLTAGKNLSSKYLYYFCIQYDFLRHNKATTIPSLTKADLLKVEIPFPPLETQNRIAQILDDTAALRDKTQQLLKEYDLLAQSIFLEMFGDPVLNQKDWNMLKLADVTTKIGSGATPRGGKESYKEKGISLIRSLNVHDNRFKMKDLAFIDKLQASKLNNVTIEEEDVLINITGASVARCTIVPYEILPARVNQHVSILRCLKQKVNPHFLLHLIISPNSKVKLLGVGSSNAATRESITKDQLESFEIIVPPIELQNQFVEKIYLIEKQKDLAKQELKESADLFNCLLQKAFKGELV